MDTNIAKAYYAKRLKFFTDKLEKAKDDHEAEAIMYAIGSLATHGQEKFHELHIKGHAAVSV